MGDTQSQQASLLGQSLMGTNHSVYDNRLTAATPSMPFRYVPYFIYFYYIKVGGAGGLDVRHYEYHDGPFNSQLPWTEIPFADVPSIIAQLTQDARDGVLPSGQNFRNIVWRRRSYLAFVVDDENWEFQTLAQGRAAIQFNMAKGSTPNHSFFDARDIQISVGADQRAAIFMVNHMRSNANGDELGAVGQPRSQRFEFDLCVDAGYATGGERIAITLDPGGTNQGPPAQPPPIGSPDGAAD